MKRVILISSAMIGVLGYAHPIGQAAPRSDSTIYLPLVARAKENPLHTGIATYYNLERINGMSSYSSRGLLSNLRSR